MLVCDHYFYTWMFRIRSRTVGVGGFAAAVVPRIGLDDVVVASEVLRWRHGASKAAAGLAGLPRCGTPLTGLKKLFYIWIGSFKN